MKFLVDGMLGGLAKWLRILGHTVEYEAGTDDNTILLKAKESDSIILTADDELSKRANRRTISCLLVKSRTEPERLAEVAQTFNIALTVDMRSTKCPNCGGNLRIAKGKEELVAKVPQASLKMYSEFWLCDRSGCGKAYWKGSHWRQIDKTLAVARQLSGQ